MGHPEHPEQGANLRRCQPTQIRFQISNFKEGKATVNGNRKGKSIPPLQKPQGWGTRNTQNRAPILGGASRRKSDFKLQISKKARQLRTASAKGKCERQLRKATADGNRRGESIAPLQKPQG